MIRGLRALQTAVLLASLLVETPLPAADTPPVNRAGDDVSDAVRAAVDAAIQKVYPALVRIHVVSVDYHGGREVKSQGFGSGAIISADGYVITNHHVAGK